jgi:hypothetical protein
MDTFKARLSDASKATTYGEALEYFNEISEREMRVIAIANHAGALDDKAAARKVALLAKIGASITRAAELMGETI